MQYKSKTCALVNNNAFDLPEVDEIFGQDINTSADCIAENSQLFARALAIAENIQVLAGDDLTVLEEILVGQITELVSAFAVGFIKTEVM